MIETTTTTCANCHQEITGNFCSNCGQKKYKRIDKKYLVDELQYTILHTNKGFFYTLKNLLKNPGKTARDFIDGNRINHYKPILMVFLLSTLSAFIMFKVIGTGEVMERFYSEFETPYASEQNQFMIWISNYMPIIMMLSIPVFAFVTKIAFRKWGHNYYEHFVLNAFIVSIYTVLNILILHPISYLIKDNATNYMVVNSLVMFVFTPFLLIWFFRGFYQEKDKTYTTLRALLSFGIFMGFYIGVIIIGVIVMVIYMKTSGVDFQQVP